MRHPPTMNSFETFGAYLPLMLTATDPTWAPPTLPNTMMKNGTDTTNLADGAPTNDS